MRPWPISPNRSKRPCHSGSANATDWVTRRHLPRKPHTCVCLGGSSGGSVQFPVLGPLRIWYRISMGLQWPHTASALSSASGWFSDGSGWLAADKALCPLHLRARRVCLASGSSCNVVCPVVPRVLFVPLVLLWYVFRNEVRFRLNVHHHLESCPLQGFTAHPNPWAKRYPRGGLGTNLRLPRRSLSVIWDTPQTNGQAQDMSSVRLRVTTSPSCRAPPPLTARAPQVVFLLFASMVSLFRYLGTREALAQAWGRLD